MIKDKLCYTYLCFEFNCRIYFADLRKSCYKFNSTKYFTDLRYACYN